MFIDKEEEVSKKSTVLQGGLIPQPSTTCAPSQAGYTPGCTYQFRVDLKDSLASGKKTILINGTEVVTQMKM